MRNIGDLIARQAQRTPSAIALTFREQDVAYAELAASAQRIAFTKIVQRVPVRIATEATPAVQRLLLPGLSVTVSVDTISAKGDLDQIRDQQDRQR